MHILLHLLDPLCQLRIPIIRAFDYLLLLLSHLIIFPLIALLLLWLPFVHAIITSSLSSMPLIQSQSCLPCHLAFLIQGLDLLVLFQFFIHVLSCKFSHFYLCSVDVFPQQSFSTTTSSFLGLCWSLLILYLLY